MSVDLSRAIPESALATLFTDAHTTYAFDGKPVPRALLEQIVELTKLGPTAMNTHPLRVVFVSGEAKDRLLPHIAEFNRPKSESASVVAVLAVDNDFHLHMARTTPHMKNAAEGFVDQAKRQSFARDNAFIEIGTFIAAARALGLDAGPMSGIDRAGIDAEFFAGTSWRSLIVVNLGYAADAENAQRPRAERLRLDELAAFVD